MRHLVRTSNGKMVHRSECSTVKKRFALPWFWADSVDDEEVWVTGLNKGATFCKICDPCDASSRKPLYYPDGTVITTAEASELMKNFTFRHIRTTNLDFMGHELAVITSFVPVDHGPEHGKYTSLPHCWLTEIVGGPLDIDGTTGSSASPNAATQLHEDVVAQALASGCTLR